MKLTGQYDMETIKYFRPQSMVIEFPCPYCGKQIEIDARDGLIEYPKPEQIIDWIRCDCDRAITIKVKIVMLVEIEYEVQP